MSTRIIKGTLKRPDSTPWANAEYTVRLRRPTNAVGPSPQAHIVGKSDFEGKIEFEITVISQGFYEFLFPDRRPWLSFLLPEGPSPVDLGDLPIIELV